ncbi:MAG TPA: hypothetical protein ENK39_09655 [Epsilonproteobacteria bacterium]|nr:hypothetical protein [Campylobacterota bacterium]
MELHDIFPAVEIVEHSFYLFLSLFIGLVALLYLAYKVWKNKPKGPDYYLNIIESALHSDAKQTAYKLEYYGNYIVKTPQQQEELTTLLEALKPFKYVPDSTLFPEETEEKLKAFLQNIRQENV